MIDRMVLTNMNTSDWTTNLTFSSTTEHTVFNQSNATISLPSSHSLDSHDPQFTIMLVLGLSLLLAALAIFLAVCRPSGQHEDCEADCGPGEKLNGRRSQSSEPQLKVWKRLGSYRRSYNLSFRRPPYRRPREHGNTCASKTAQPGVSKEPQLTTPCLHDYVTEI
ncbi:uncharacterized protein LOC133657378 isoform X2 [Entelurus aequoreus]|uniref:uncharacterized protein LOC133656837 isoform X2 n=1 Tax=Entelurus aequoreus TaxID=161455 RepID=UPI002B1D1A7F|nr:uncharacterized protein LOC133656837 isoform X2 [Entelurus aequoreus]XP_061914630.1 uncharacterized protein LOC133657378 isoform X2 [Entelurus aequoreus]